MRKEDYDKLSLEEKQILVKWFMFTSSVFKILVNNGMTDTAALKVMRRVLTGKNLKWLDK